MAKKRQKKDKSQKKDILCGCFFLYLLLGKKKPNYGRFG